MATCPICFEEIKNRASPDSCDHVFCLSCLEKWSKLGSFCPVDRKRYKKIVNLESDEFIQVKSRKRKKCREVYDFSAKCEICEDENKPEVLLLCDCCDLAYHIHCLSPPLKVIPAGLWFCPTCTSVEKKLKEKNGITKEVEVDLSNSNLVIQKGGRHGRRTKEKFAEVTEDPEPTLEFTKDKNCSSLFEDCDEIVIEFEGISPRRYDNGEFLNSYASSVNIDEKMCKSYRLEPQSPENREIKVSKTYQIKKRRGNLNKKIEMKYINTKIKSDDDFCLKQSNEVSLIDDCLSQAATIGNLKIDSNIDLSDSEEKHLNQVSHTKHGILPSCSGVSEQSIKGICQTLISSLSVDPCLEKADFDCDTPKDKNDLTKEKVFSVFDRIESASASQNKYIDIDTKSCGSASSGLNLAHCFSCQDVIKAASQNYCKICKLLRYSISCASDEKDDNHSDSLKYSQAFEYSCGIGKRVKNRKNNSQRKTGKDMKRVFERRTRSLIHKLRKISESQQISETC